MKSNIVTAINIDHQDAPDSPEFPALVRKTAENFKIDEVTGDKAYAGNPNFEVVEANSGKFFPAFKSNTTGGAGGSFEKAFHYFSLHKEEYLAHYHLRSNIESTVNMVKAKFGSSVKANNELAQKKKCTPSLSVTTFAS